MNVALMLALYVRTDSPQQSHFTPPKDDALIREASDTVVKSSASSGLLSQNTVPGTQAAVDQSPQRPSDVTSSTEVPQQRDFENARNEIESKLFQGKPQKLAAFQAMRAYFYKQSQLLKSKHAQSCPIENLCPELDQDLIVLKTNTRDIMKKFLTQEEYAEYIAFYSSEKERSAARDSRVSVGYDF